MNPCGRARTADAAAQQARDAQRARYDALVHDRILAVMLSVRAQKEDHALAVQAQHAMDDLDRALTDGQRPSVNAAELLALVRGTVADVDTRIPFADYGFTDGCNGLIVPGVAAEALADAAAEAIRNCLRHAGPNVTINVRATTDDYRGRVTVQDDGIGFDPRTVRPDRMGIAVSIRGRMAAAGGRALVRSSPGNGTHIVLEWPA